MWARCWAERTGFLTTRTPTLRSLIALFLALGALGAGAAVEGEAQTGRDRAGLDVVDSEGDTLPVVRRVTITREGVSVDRTGDAPIRVRDDLRVPMGDDVGEGSYFVNEEGETLAQVTLRGSPGDVVSFFRDVEIPAGRLVRGEVVSILGDIRIDGEVDGDVVAVMGRVVLGDSARVGGDAVAIGGVDAAPGAVVQGDAVSIPVLGVPTVSPWVLWSSTFVAALFFAALGALVALLFPARTRRIAETGARRTLLSILIGILAFPLVLVVSILLMLTMIGIPVGVLLLVLYPVANFVGFTAACVLLGSRLRRDGLEDGSIWLSAVLGVLFVAAFMVLGGVISNLEAGGGVAGALGMALMGVGVFFSLILSTLGTGALFVSRLGEPERAPTPGSTTQPV